MIAATSWPEAAVAMGGILLVISVAVALIVSVGSTIRARMSVQREAAYRKLAEDATAAQHRTADQLERAIAELGEIRTRTGELERIIKAVD
jgi:flagellar basal body-associated protein FliL